MTRVITLWIQGLGLKIWAIRSSCIRTCKFLIIIQSIPEAKISRCIRYKVLQQYHKDPAIFVKDRYESQSSETHLYIHAHRKSRNLHKVWEVLSRKTTDITIINVCDNCLCQCFSTFDPWTHRDQHHTPKRPMSGAQELLLHTCHTAT